MGNQGQIVLLQQMLRHGPLVSRGQEGAFQVNARQFRALVFQGFPAAHLRNAPFGLLLGVGENRCLPSGSALLGKEP